jgi:hypothetical protein
MKIYILDTDTAKCAEMLDDESLNKQIKALAQVLCNVHFSQCTLSTKRDDKFDSIPLTPKNLNDVFTTWVRECVANYKYLAKLGLACCEEWNYRFGLGDNYITDFSTGTVEWRWDTDPHKSQPVIEWARDNVPDLGKSDCSECGGDGQSKHDSEGCLICNGTGYISEITPFPLVMPENDIVYYNEVLKTRAYGKEAIPVHCKEDKFKPDITESYRNYYAAKIKCKECNGDGHHYCNSSVGEWVSACKCDGGINATWTRREKPEWLNI